MLSLVIAEVLRHMPFSMPHLGPSPEVRKIKASTDRYEAAQLQTENG